MNHRSGMDASFLHFETPKMPVHVGRLQILNLPAGDAGDFYADVKRHGAGRMHLADVFQRKLALMPFELANRSGSMTKTSTSATTFAMSSCPGLAPGCSSSAMRRACIPACSTAAARSGKPM